MPNHDSYVFTYISRLINEHSGNIHTKNFYSSEVQQLRILTLLQSLTEVPEEDHCLLIF